MLGKFPALKDLGVEEIIVNSNNIRLANSFIKEARAVGIRCRMLYSYLYFGFNGSNGTIDRIGDEISKAITIAKENDIRTVAVDIEAVGEYEFPGTTFDGRVRDTWRAISLLEEAGLSVMVYTYPYYWTNQMRNTAQFSKYPLWLAQWADNAGGYSEVRTVNFGGWINVDIHQWTSSTKIMGNDVDHNTIFTNILDTIGENDMPDPRIDKLVKVMGGQGLIDVWEADGDSLLLGYENLQNTVSQLAVTVNELTNTVNTMKAEQATLASSAKADSDRVVNAIVELVNVLKNK